MQLNSGAANVCHVEGKPKCIVTGCATWQELSRDAGPGHALEPLSLIVEMLAQCSVEIRLAATSFAGEVEEIVFWQSPVRLHAVVYLVYDDLEEKTVNRQAGVRKVVRNEEAAVLTSEQC